MGLKNPAAAVLCRVPKRPGGNLIICVAHCRTNQDTVWATYDCFRSAELLGELSLALYGYSSALRSNGWNSVGSGTIGSCSLLRLFRTIRPNTNGSICVSLSLVSC